MRDDEHERCMGDRTPEEMADRKKAELPGDFCPAGQCQHGGDGMVGVWQSAAGMV